MFFFSSKAKEIFDDLKKMKDLHHSVQDLNEKNKRLLEIIEEREQGLINLEQEKSQGFPWLAKAIAEYHFFLEIALAHYLDSKKHRAAKASEAVKDIARENRKLRTELRTTKYILEYYESLFPWLKEYLGEDKDEFIQEITETQTINGEDADPVSRFLTPAEYHNLSAIEKNQLALDRYKTSKKSPYIIGRDYERYIGYLYETSGFNVEYTGIAFGLEDLGRDLVCKKDGIIEIVQCKCWSAHKTIHEKHINQLFGTAVKYFIDNVKSKPDRNLAHFPESSRLDRVNPVFVTSTCLSETARDFACVLGIRVQENKKLLDYPMIKCNIGSRHEKIYHLPFDQQYDKTYIDKPGEFYASTVAEAELKGFRRAYRWKGN